MHYSYTIPAAAIRPAIAFGPFAIPVQVASRHAEADRRWPRLLRILKALRMRGRRSIRIVDTACGNGELLVAASRRARALGFVAIEGRGIDRDPVHVARARATAGAAADPAIGLSFEVGHPGAPLIEEAAFPADILLCGTEVGDNECAARAAGRIVLRDTSLRVQA